MWFMKNNKRILEQIRVAVNKAPSPGLMQPLPGWIRGVQSGWADAQSHSSPMQVPLYSVRIAQPLCSGPGSKPLLFYCIWLYWIYFFSLDAFKYLLHDTLYDKCSVVQPKVYAPFIECPPYGSFFAQCFILTTVHNLAVFIFWLGKVKLIGFK